jgi:CheY-like chemotaxis protein
MGKVEYDVIISDYHMPGKNGLRALGLGDLAYIAERKQPQKTHRNGAHL